MARGALLKALVNSGEVFSRAPAWAPSAPEADAYIGIAGELLLGLIWTGATDDRPLLALFVHTRGQLAGSALPEAA